MSYSPLQSMNAFSVGQQIGTGIRNDKTQNAFSQMIGDNDLQGARDYAYGRGALQLGQGADAMIAAQQPQTQAPTQNVGQLKALTENMLQMPEAQRGEFLMSNWQNIEPIVGTDFMTFWQASGGDVSDQSLNEDLALFRSQLGEAPPVQEVSAPAEPIKVGDRLIDPSTYEVLYEPPAEAPAGPKPMTPYQQAQLGLQGRRLALEESEFEASQRPDYSELPPAFQPVAGNQPQGYERINASFGSTLTPFDEFVEGERGGSDEQPRDLAMYNKYRGSSMAKADTARLDELNQNTVSILNTQRPKLQQMKQLLESDVPIGPMADTRVKMGRMGVGPLSKDQVAQMETFNNLSTDLRLELTSKTKGAISNKEWEDFARAVPNWNQNPEGAQMMIRAYEQINDRAIMYQEAANGWSSHYGGLSVPDGDGQTFDSYWQAYTSRNPLQFDTRNSMRDVMGAARSAAEAQGWTDQGGGLSESEETRYQELLRKQQEGTIQ